MAPGMSDLLPSSPLLWRISPEARRNAAISVCQFADYERESTTEYLLALGLIVPTSNSHAPVIELDGENWFAKKETDG